MIGTTITCSECNEPYIVVGDSIKLPYVCIKCEEEVEEFNKATAPAQTTSQMVQAEAEYIEGDPGDEHEHVHNQGDECEGATVEATTELIADLEAQVTGHKAAFEEALAGWKEAVGIARQFEAKLDIEMDVTNRLGELVVDFVTKNQELTADKDEATESLHVARKLLRQLMERNRLLREQRNFEYKLKRNAQSEASFYRTRGFWARLFNVRYKATGLV